MMDDADVREVRQTPQPELGKRLRAIRLESGRSLAEVAQATEISPSFLSMVENGNSDISIGRLLRLTQHYGAEIAQVVSGADKAPQDVVHAGERRSLVSMKEGLEIEFLAEAHRPLRPLIVRFEPQGGMLEPVRDSGDAFLYVLAGELVVEVDGEPPLVLRDGDSVYLPGDRARLYRNHTDEPVTLLSVVLRQEALADAAATTTRGAVSH